MKALLFSALALISVVSHAGSRGDGLYADFPKVQFGSVFVPVDEVCVADDHVKTLYLVPVCVEWKGNGEDNSCSKFESKILSTPIHYKKEIPAGGEGDNTTITIDMHIPLDYDIAYGYWTEGGFQTVRTEPFSLPVCE